MRSVCSRMNRSRGLNSPLERDFRRSRSMFAIRNFDSSSSILLFMKPNTRWSFVLRVGAGEVGHREYAGAAEEVPSLQFARMSSTTSGGALPSGCQSQVHQTKATPLSTKDKTQSHDRISISIGFIEFHYKRQKRRRPLLQHYMAEPDGVRPFLAADSASFLSKVSISFSAN